MSLFKLLWGKRLNLDSKEKKEGNIYFCKDDCTLHVDYVDDNGEIQRQQINAKKADYLSGALLAYTLTPSDSEIPTSNAVATYVGTEISNLVNSAPETLDTLGELATAFEENQDVVEVLDAAITTKHDKIADTLILVDAITGEQYKIQIQNGQLVSFPVAEE